MIILNKIDAVSKGILYKKSSMPFVLGTIAGKPSLNTIRIFRGVI